MLTMGAALVRAERHFGRQTAMIEEDGARSSWRDHMDRVVRLAGALRSLGVMPGSRFAILAPNSVRQAELIHAGYWSGAIPVPLNFRLAPPEIAAILDECAAGVLFVDAMFQAAAEKLVSGGYPGRVFLLGPHEGEGEVEGTDQLVAQHDGIDPFPGGEQDEALLLFTGGTTGAGKGVPLSHANIVSNGMQVGLALAATAQDAMLHVAPMFHSADLLGTAITLVGGAHSYLAQPAPDTFAAAVSGREITFTMIPPVLLHGLVHGGFLDGSAFENLRVFISGGAPVPFDLLAAAQKCLPNGSMVQGYGLTETSPILTFMHLCQARALTGGDSQACRSAGRPLAGLETRLVDENWLDVPDGEPGEFAVRGPNVFGRYLNRPNDTAAAFRDGWFRTGDVARIDDDGYVHIIDRTKDVIITGGENVYSAEVEAVLSTCPEILEVAVIGLPDEKWGEQVTAVIVLKPGSSEEPSIVEFCRGKIAGYKIPRHCIFVSELPKSPLGKVLKGSLRETYQ